MANEPVRHGDTIVQVPQILVDRVRRDLGDDPQTNELTRTLEWTDDTLARYVVEVLQDFNVTPPPVDTKVTPIMLYTGAFQDLQAWVVDATVARALKAGAIAHMRQDQTITAGSVTFNPHAQWQGMLAIAREMEVAWEQRKKQKKLEMNIEGAYSVAHSDFLVDVTAEGGLISVNTTII